MFSAVITIWLKHLSYCSFLFSVMFLPAGVAAWAQGSEDTSEDLCLTRNWGLRGIHCLSRMTQQEGGPPNSKWREERMGANGSSYPHSCSPRIGGNAQAQHTFIGMYFICGLIKSISNTVDISFDWWLCILSPAFFSKLKYCVKTLFLIPYSTVQSRYKPVGSSMPKLTR